MKRSGSIGVAVGLCLVAIAAPLAGLAAAQSRECFFVGNRFVCVNVAPGGEVTPVDEGPGSPLGTWRLLPISVAPGVPAECVDENGNPSTVWILTFYPNDRSQGVVSTVFCQEVPVPPPPPTAEEAWRAAAVPEPGIHINPNGLGATGIETWLWGSSAASIPVSVTVRGYTVSGVTAPTQWRWNMGATGGTSNPPPDLRANVPGSTDQPAARYSYETKGTYTVTHNVVWSGTFTVTGWGLAGLTLDAGAIVVESSRPYAVAEIRSVRLPPEGSG